MGAQTIANTQKLIHQPRKSIVFPGYPEKAPKAPRERPGLSAGGANGAAAAPLMSQDCQMLLEFRGNLRRLLTAPLTQIRLLRTPGGEVGWDLGIALVPPGGALGLPVFGRIGSVGASTRSTLHAGKPPAQTRRCDAEGAEPANDATGHARNNRAPDEPGTLGSAVLRPEGVRHFSFYVSVGRCRFLVPTQRDRRATGQEELAGRAIVPRGRLQAEFTKDLGGHHRTRTSGPQVA